MKIKFLTGALLFILPVFVFAQQPDPDPTYLHTLITAFLPLINILIKVALSVGLLMFIWGLVKFITHSGNEKSIEQGRQFMIWGVIILFVMVSVWGIIALMQTMFDADGGAPMTVPSTTYP